MNSDDVELDCGFNHAHDGECDWNAGHGWQVDDVAVPVLNGQA